MYPLTVFAIGGSRKIRDVQYGDVDDRKKIK